MPKFNNFITGHVLFDVSPWKWWAVRKKLLTCWAWHWDRGRFLLDYGSSCVWNQEAIFPKRTRQGRMRRSVRGRGEEREREGVSRNKHKKALPGSSTGVWADYRVQRRLQSVHVWCVFITQSRVEAQPMLLLKYLKEGPYNRESISQL